MAALVSDGDALREMASLRSTYEQLTGKIDEDHEEYELRMRSFNEWFLFESVSTKCGMPFMLQFLNSLEKPLPGPGGERLGKAFRELQVNYPEVSLEKIKNLFSNVCYSIFDCHKKTFGRHLVLKDLIMGKRYGILPENLPFDILSNEFFAGRIIDLGDEAFIFKGMRWLPPQIKPLVMKKVKKIRQLGNPSAEKKFVFKLELAKTKSIHFRHVNPVKIFSSLIA